jgi:putative serine protease PepD
MSGMNRTGRLSNVFFTFLGAASVGLVVAVLAVAGAFDNTERVVEHTPSTPTTSTPVDSNSATASDSVSQIYAKTSPGVAFIENGGNGATGSGFLLDSQGHVVTNEHVVEGSNTFTIRFGEEGPAIAGKLLGKDASTDLAVISVDPAKVPAETKPL